MGVSKSYSISRQSGLKYETIRENLTQKALKLFSFSGWNSKSISSKEQFWALKDISFDIYQGDRIGIIGKNGAGKSTLLKIISRITAPDSGTIKIKGSVSSLLEVGTGFHPELTGRENIFLNGAILGMTRQQIISQFDAIVDFAEIEKFLDTPVKKYSSGMYVRLAFAVAAHLQSEILIVDEVLAVGDAQFQNKCIGKIEEVSNNEGRTVLFVSHNMGVISRLCNKGILLADGKIKAEGEIQKLIANYYDSSDQSKYEASNDAKNVYFKKIELFNTNIESAADFAFDEAINLRFSFSIKDVVDNLQIGISLQDKLGKRVFTILKPVDFFNQHSDGFFHGNVELPSALIAPGSYNFIFAIWSVNGHVYELLEGVCPVSIYDNGTDLALYQGVDYGNVIINPLWKNS